jgi:Holliday junction resolvase RusA-like endonuclease
MVKFVLDALNGRAYEDDGQVALLTAGKMYTEDRSRTEVRIRRLKDEDALRMTECSVI